MYKKKFPVGHHYHVAHVALQHDTIGILGKKNGEIVASGTVSKKQIEELQKRGLPTFENNIIVDYKEYEKLCQEYIYEKEAYIEANNIKIEGLTYA